MIFGTWEVVDFLMVLHSKECFRLNSIICPPHVPFRCLRVSLHFPFKHFGYESHDRVLTVLLSKALPDMLIVIRSVLIGLTTFLLSNLGCFLGLGCFFSSYSSDASSSSEESFRCFFCIQECCCSKVI